MCNGCENLKKCTLRKKFYVAKEAQEEYEQIRSEARTGIAITENELANLDKILTPLIKKGQSIHHICVNNADRIMCSEKTLYNYIDSGLFTACNIDLTRKVKYRPRKKAGLTHKVDRSCRIGRTYDDFHSFLEHNSYPLIVEMDSVIGKVGGKVLLTLHFVKSEFMLAFLRNSNDSQSVIDVFNKLNEILGIDLFKELFPVLLGDNGSEFSNPTAIECNHTTGEVRTKLFYCDPLASFQKGSAEKKSRLKRAFCIYIVLKILENINSLLKENTFLKIPLHFPEGVDFNLAKWILLFHSTITIKVFLLYDEALIAK
ncbi:MAG: hypothetical protein PHC69_02350 [Ruminiclostridium sp.]|nr:hypothetical protein [Ruminiclostridium sp.]